MRLSKLYKKTRNRCGSKKRRGSKKRHDSKKRRDSKKRCGSKNRRGSKKRPNKILSKSYEEAGWNPINVSLLKAVETNDYEGVRRLFNNKTLNVNYLWTEPIEDSFGDPTYYTPLMLSVEKSHIEITELLLKHTSIDVNRANNAGVTPLCVAIGNNDYAMAVLLLGQEQINVNQQTTELGYTPLHLASSNNLHEMVNLLLTHNNINVNVQNFDGNTPLHLASEKDCIGVVKELTKAPNIQLSIKNNDNKTAADMAYEHENFGCASPKECFNMFWEFKNANDVVYTSDHSRNNSSTQRL
jgi:ankyrin repeat protein